jgi:hypothetical protein
LYYITFRYITAVSLRNHRNFPFKHDSICCTGRFLWSVRLLVLVKTAMCNVTSFNKLEILFTCILVVLFVSMILLNNHCVYWIILQVLRRNLKSGDIFVTHVCSSTRNIAQITGLWLKCGVCSNIPKQLEYVSPVRWPSHLHCWISFRGMGLKSLF